MKITAVFFSATGTTRRIVRSIAENLGGEVNYIDLTGRQLEEDLQLSADELLVIGMPVYAGRVPSMTVDSLKHIKGSHSPAILVAVYGNRAYDDVFVELQDIVEPCGFFVFAAGAFIAQHSIFPKTAAGRPDTADFLRIGRFCDRCKDRMYMGFSDDLNSIRLPGNRPYRQPGSIPLQVKAGRKCTGCGVCAGACPVGAISLENLRVSDPERCIHCARCIAVCPEHARGFAGLSYRIVAHKFGKKNKIRKEPEFFF